MRVLYSGAYSLAWERAVCHRTCAKRTDVIVAPKSKPPFLFLFYLKKKYQVYLVSSGISRYLKYLICYHQRSSQHLNFSNCFYFFLSFFSIYFYQLEANYFTVLQWFLPYIDMNQPWIYMCSPTLSCLPLHPIPLGLPSAPALSTRLMHPTWAGDLFHT